ncbi:DUF4232 domain-containing protein [Pseudonocardia lacus]|uniref:DUF4232 domain-containing protein n=1 Tax=Pseudonocardia lacus TaxID=2835865 RepID=UPI001BDD41BF|nr:DUF4232 domain-containing protein [Pseudonocardia lacus]
MSTREETTGTTAGTAPSAWPTAALGSGLVVMVVGVLAAPGPRTPFGEAGLADRDPSPVVLAAPWVAVVVGLGAALAGLVALCLAPAPAAPDDARSAGAPLAVKAPAAGAVGGIVLLALSPAVLLLTLSGVPGLLAGLSLVWLGQVGALTLVDRGLGPATRRVAPDAPPVALAALVAACAAGAAAGGDGLDVVDVVLAAVVQAACVTVGLLATRGHRAGIGVGVVGVGAVAAAVLVAGVVLATGSDQEPTTCTPGVAAPALPGPAPRPAEPLPTYPAPAPVEASDACRVDDLVWSTTGWDAALGERVVSVLARNATARPCFVEGVPDVRLAQGGQALPLAIDLTRAEYDPALQGSEGRTGIAPGGVASFGLRWRVGAGADRDTPQTLGVALGPGGAWADVAVDDEHPAPFDVTAGAELSVGGWRPAG